jgi:16S rRNA (cytosine967-C5)-methyltransferase
MLSVFSESDLDHYSKRQRQIIKNALTFLKPGGKLIYLTCSVFSAENELNALYLQEKTDLKIVSEKYCGGYEKDADFIYRAIFTL